MRSSIGLLFLALMSYPIFSGAETGPPSNANIPGQSSLFPRMYCGKFFPIRAQYLASGIFSIIEPSNLQKLAGEYGFRPSEINNYLSNDFIFEIGQPSSRLFAQNRPTQYADFYSKPSPFPAALASYFRADDVSQLTWGPGSSGPGPYIRAMSPATNGTGLTTAHAFIGKNIGVILTNPLNLVITNPRVYSGSAYPTAVESGPDTPFIAFCYRVSSDPDAANKYSILQLDTPENKSELAGLTDVVINQFGIQSALSNGDLRKLGNIVANQNLTLEIAEAGVITSMGAIALQLATRALARTNPATLAASILPPGALTAFGEMINGRKYLIPANATYKLSDLKKFFTLDSDVQQSRLQGDPGLRTYLMQIKSAIDQQDFMRDFANGNAA